MELVFPTRCVGCESYGVLLCGTCRAALQPIDPVTACPRCGAPYGSLVCTECTGRDGRVPFSFSAARCAFSFNETLARLVVGYKDHDERRLAACIAGFLAEALPGAWLEWADAVTYIPANRAALRRRGFDHMRDVAAALASQTGQAFAELLAKGSAGDQRALGRSQRAANLAGAFRVAATPFARDMPAHVIVLDDVLTTGATLNAASEALVCAGVLEVRVATLARVW
jgi:ComF family protein